VVAAFCRTLGGHPEFKRFENPFRNQSNTLQKSNTPTHQYTHTPFSRFVRVTSKKVGENWGFEQIRGCEKMREREMGVIGVMGWAAVMMGGGVVP
jgi:hypothetical protein